MSASPIRLVGGDAQVVEEDLGGGVVDHGADGLDGHALADRFAEIDEEDREPFGALLHLVLGRGARQQQHEVGVLGAAGPYLLSVDDVLVPVKDRRGGEAEGIGAAGRLGDAEGLEAQAPGGDLGQVAVLLGRAAVTQDGAHGVHLGVARGTIAARGVDLFQDRPPGVQGQAAAAVLLGDEGGQVAGLGEGLNELRGIGPLAVKRAPIGAGKALAQRPDGVPDVLKFRLVRLHGL